MTIQTLNWCSDEQLDCGAAALPTLAVICIPASIANPPPVTASGIVIADIIAVRPSTCADLCGPCKWIYTFQYDDGQLIPGYILVQSSVLGVICDSCLLQFVVTYVALVPPGQVCAESTETLDLFVNQGTGCVQGRPIISLTSNNCLQAFSDGLFVGCPAPQFIQSLADTLTVDLTITGAQLTGDVKVSADASNAVEVHVDGLYVPQTAALGLAVTDTASVALTLAAGPTLSADVKVSGDAGNEITTHADGIYAPTVCVADSDTLQFYLDVNGCVSGNVKVSGDAGNIITENITGIYAPTPPADFIESIADTPTIDLSVGAGILTAALKISADSFNLAEVHSDGLWIPATDGWIPFNATLTYVSANSFSLVGDWTDRISKGDKIKVTDTTIKYFSVFSVVFSAGTTTVSITAGIDNTLSGGAITLPFLSHDVSPAKFPGWFNWTPSYSASGAMTWTSVTTNTAKFRIERDACFFMIDADGTTGGTASNHLYATLPVAEFASQVAAGGGDSDTPAGGTNGFAGVWRIIAAVPGKLEITRYDSQNYALGAAATARFTGFYQIAA